MLSKEMAKINWDEKTSQEIKNLVRGLNPIMGAYTMLDDKKVKFWKVQTVLEEEMLTKILEKENSENASEDSILNPTVLKNRINGLENGTVIFSSDKDGLYIKAKEGFISVLEIQGENAKRMNIKDFLRGNHIQAGSLFE
jgi:methionyl-tRNA formyltransferase